MNHAEGTGAVAPRPLVGRLLARLTGAVAVLGGLLMLASALLVVASVLGRWLFSSPIDGDFEFVKMGTAVAIFAYLPYTQARRGNISVDTFTSRLPRTLQAALDALWDLAYAAVAAAIAYALWVGALDALENGETTMQRQIVIWPSIAICAVLAGVLALTAVVGLAGHFARSGRGSPA